MKGDQHVLTPTWKKECNFRHIHLLLCFANFCNTYCTGTTPKNPTQFQQPSEILAPYVDPLLDATEMLELCNLCVAMATNTTRPHTNAHRRIINKALAFCRVESTQTWSQKCVHPFFITLQTTRNIYFATSCRCLCCMLVAKSCQAMNHVMIYGNARLIFPDALLQSQAGLVYRLCTWQIIMEHSYKIYKHIQIIYIYIYLICICYIILYHMCV